MEAPKSLGQAAHQAKALWLGLKPGQRAWLSGGAVLVGITLWVFASLLGRPKYVTLYSGLKPADAQALGSRLGARNIPYQLSPDGSTLLVPAEQLDASRLETASQGLPRNARLGFELFDTPNWAGSDFTEKVNYQRALEGELERTLQTLSEVEAARVHLVLPRESLFTDQEREAKAAVILKTRGGALSPQAQLAIPQLVASAVEGLRPENVTVVDADSNTSLIHAHSMPGGGAADLDEQLQKTLLQTLAPVVGPDHVRASVHVEYDLSTSDDTEEVYDPKTTATLTQQKSEEIVGGGGPGGIPGTASNLPTAAGAAKPVVMTSDSETSHSESETFAVSKSVRHTLQPAGRVKRIAAAVLIDDALDPGEAGKPPLRRKRTADEMKEIEQLAAAAIGLDAQRGDVLAVQNLAFQEPVLPKPVPPGKIEATRKFVFEWLGLLRYLAIFTLFLIVYFLMLRPVKKQIMTSLRELPARMAHSKKTPGEPGAALAAGGVEIELPAGTDQARRAGTLKKQLADKVKAEPAAAGRLVQSWIRETEKS
ncbi:MAG: flagellar basal-body MS-ring/collar protein FliF [Terriglobales bacterium]